jgi:hypothetical protein
MDLPTFHPAVAPIIIFFAAALHPIFLGPVNVFGSRFDGSV